MERIGEGLCGQFIGLNAFQRIGRFKGKADIMEVKSFQNAQMIFGGFDHRFFRVLIFTVKTAGIDADTDRDMPFFAGSYDLFDLVFVFDIARIETDLIGAVGDGFQCEIGIEMNVADQRDGNSFLDLFHRFGVFHIEYGDSDDFAAGFFQSFDLTDCRFDIFCFGVCHRLDDYFILTADLNTADLDRPGFCSFHTFIIKQKAVSDAHSFERQCIHR